MQDIVTKIVSVIEKRSALQITAGCLVLVAALSLLDYLTGDFSLILFYLAPIFIACWFVGIGAGAAVCVVSELAIIAIRLFPAAKAGHTAFMQVWNTFIEFCFLILLNYLFSILKKELDMEKTLARTDYLTGAYNRRSFLELAEYEIGQSQRYGRSLTIAYIDLDNFKAVNDTMGHHAGDRLLCIVAQVMRESSRSTDLVVRLGGDEFAILYPETATTSASEVLDKLQNHLLAAMSLNNWPVTFSIGAVTFLTPPVSAEAMLREADSRMYDVKMSGKNMISHVTLKGEDIGLSPAEVLQ